ncbi:5965_t:CDS:2, partial [Scutellospora calospora]
MNSVLREISSWKDTFVDDVSELSNEQLEIRKSFEAADKFIPEIAANAYSNTHPKSAWKSKYLILPRIPDSQNEDLDDIIL